MQKALNLAEQAAKVGEVPVGCVIVCDEKLISEAHNEVEKSGLVSAHAELLALERAAKKLNNKYLEGCTLYVTLEPCPMCAGALVWSKIDRIVFGAMDPKAGACGTLFNVSDSNKLNHRIEIIHGVLESDCEELLKEFFRAKRRTQDL
jgi:tRNA(adenine34) deaminase